MDRTQFISSSSSPQGVKTGQLLFRTAGPLSVGTLTARRQQFGSYSGITGSPVRFRWRVVLGNDQTPCARINLHDCGFCILRRNSIPFRSTGKVLQHQRFRVPESSECWLISSRCVTLATTTLGALIHTAASTGTKTSPLAIRLASGAAMSLRLAWSRCRLVHTAGDPCTWTIQ